MSRYRRARIPGGTFFFTLTLADRSSDLLVRHVNLLRNAYALVQQRYPFKTIAICVLPDHIHTVWMLPEGDTSYSKRWGLIKGRFSRDLPAPAFRSPSKVAKRDKGIWQRRYWEHVIRNAADLERHVDYIHFNPVKHKLVARVRDWPHSSFHRYVSHGMLQENWGGDVRDLPGAFGE